MMMMLFVIVILLSGCASNDKVYGVAKSAYKVGETIAPLVPMDEKTRATLRTVDAGAKLYDQGRTAVRSGQDKKK